MPDPARYRLTLRSVPSSIPAPVRLRRLLKALLRAYGFRCIWYEEFTGLTDSYHVAEEMARTGEGGNG
jgi:hypothetical protein